MEHQYELVITIVNRGYAEIAMEAARTAGATGGTVAHGRGTGGKESKKLLGIAIQPEKEIILILVSTAIRDGVMRAVTATVGLDTNGQGVCFSMPVEAAAGATFGNLEAFANEESSPKRNEPKEEHNSSDKTEA